MRESIDAFVSYLQEVKGAPENTWISYKRDLNKLDRFFAGQGLSEVKEITVAHLNAYMQSLKEQELKEATISRHLASIRMFFRYLCEYGVIPEDISESLAAPKIEKQIPEVLTAEEAARLLGQPAGEKPANLRDRAMLELLYATGIRVSELVSLKLSDVDMQNEYIECGSGIRRRIIPFGGTATMALFKYLYLGRDKLLRKKNCDRLFLNFAGGPLSRQGFWKIVKFYVAEAGIEKEITPHTLRHSFAANMVQSGMDVKSLQARMGNSDRGTAYMYYHVGEKNQDRL